MSRNANARRILARQKSETFDEWTSAARAHLPVCRGELLWFLDLMDEAQRRRTHDTRWYRRWWRAGLRPFTGRVEVAP